MTFGCPGIDFGKVGNYVNDKINELSQPEPTKCGHLGFHVNIQFVYCNYNSPQYCHCNLLVYISISRRETTKKTLKLHCLYE